MANRFVATCAFEVFYAWTWLLTAFDEIARKASNALDRFDSRANLIKRYDALIAFKQSEHDKELGIMRTAYRIADQNWRTSEALREMMLRRRDEQIADLEGERDALAARVRGLIDEIAVTTLSQANMLAGKTIPGGISLPISTWADAARAMRAGAAPDDVMQADIG